MQSLPKQGSVREAKAIGGAHPERQRSGHKPICRRWPSVSAGRCSARKPSASALWVPTA